RPVDRDQLVDVDGERRLAHPGRLNADRLATVRPGEPESATDAVHLPRALEEGLRDPLRAQRVARQEHGLGIISGLGLVVRRHVPPPPAARCLTAGAAARISSPSPGSPGMDKFTTLTAVAAPLNMINVDTDMIIPKDYLKTIERTGLGKGLFAELRYTADGKPNPDFVLNRPAYRQAHILVAGDNFGCGSSREHAPWALL